MQTKASSSVRSPVVNLGLPIDHVQQTIIDSLSKWISEIDGSHQKPKVIRVPEHEEYEYVNHGQFEQKLKEFTQWDWIYGSSPAFDVDVNDGTMSAGGDEFLDSVRLYCDRGGRVNQLKVTDEVRLDSELLCFLSRLSNALCGLECRPFAWDSALDQFWSKETFANPEPELEVEKQKLIQTLKMLSLRF
ncbi:unnamed protein product [Echinostoma caproni]|uniref:Uncharacterized protein n=1 Tax=Echinostoma caproni TaxID=27848 RepID=A0A3P8GNJ7_9TREM|nr:unnamed protein product [Echinostoma caproni]